jgi:hypothetical protein
MWIEEQKAKCIGPYEHGKVNSTWCNNMNLHFVSILLDERMELENKQ